MRLDVNADDRDLAPTGSERHDGVASGKAIHLGAIVRERMHCDDHIRAAAATWTISPRRVLEPEQQRYTIPVENWNRPSLSEHADRRHRHPDRLRPVADDTLLEPA